MKLVCLGLIALLIACASHTRHYQPASSFPVMTAVDDQINTLVTNAELENHSRFISLRTFKGKRISGRLVDLSEYTVTVATSYHFEKKNQKPQIVEKKVKIPKDQVLMLTLYNLR